MSDHRDEQTYSIIGAAMKVHRELGCGFLEAVYQESLEIELTKQRIPFERQKHISVYYDGRELKTFYIADFIVYGDVIVELKATADLTGKDKAQVLNYLKATGFSKALLVNFGKESLQFERIVYFRK